jgi:adenylate kinase
MILIILGAPGAGKGTVSQRLVKQYGIAQISTGDILRIEVKKGSPVGKEAAGYMNSGKLVPDSIIMDCIKIAVQTDSCKNGFILDGFPRTIPQADSLKKLLDDINLKLDAVINLEVPEDVLIRRLTSRRTCSNSSCQAIYNIHTMPTKKEGVCDKCGSPVVQRDDETEEIIRQRLETYKEKTQPLIQYYSKDPVFRSILGLNADDVMIELEKIL